MKHFVITGAAGTLGRALVEELLRRGCRVTAVSRRDAPEGIPPGAAFVVNTQTSDEDAEALAALDGDVTILAAGAIETEIGPAGEPLASSIDALTAVHLTFPAKCALRIAARSPRTPVQVVTVGSIADGSPSAFGPVYHATKAALHQFVTGTAPILRAANPNVRLRLYRPGVIRGDFSRAPMLRLGEAGRRVRERRCASAPGADVVARRLLRFVDGSATVGGDAAPVSFRLLQFLFAAFPEVYARLQFLAWKKAGRFPPRAG